MRRIRPAKVDNFPITIDCCLFIFTTMMSQMTLHQPRFGMVWIYRQDAVEKNLCNLPSFLGNCASSMGTIDTDL